MSILRRTYFRLQYSTYIDFEKKRFQKAEQMILLYPTNKNVCLKAVKIDGYLIKNVRIEDFDNDYSYGQFPYDYKEIALAAVKNNGYAIGYIPLDLLDDEFLKELCLAAVKNHPNSIFSIDLKKLDPDFSKKLCEVTAAECNPFKLLDSNL